MDILFEHDNDDLTVAFYDSAGALVAPTSISYRIDDVGSGNAVRASTSVTPASSVTINLKYADTAIVDQDNEIESRRLTLVANYGTDTDGNPKQKTFEYEFQVRNARFST